jgi:hypothetical protein
MTADQASLGTRPGAVSTAVGPRSYDPGVTNAPTRPPLTAELSPEEFQRWYWLRKELAAFCRAEHLPRSGSKADLAAVVVARLGGSRATSSLRPATTADEQPLTPEALIPDCVRCDQRLRAFFRERIGPSFRFTVPFQRWLHAHPGRPYSDAVAAWAELAGDTERPIEAQFEYNAFTRSYRAQHPRCSAAHVRAAWWEHRARPRSGGGPGTH